MKVALSLPQLVPLCNVFSWLGQHVVPVPELLPAALARQDQATKLLPGSRLVLIH